MVVSVASAPCDTLDFSPLDECSSLIFYNVSKHPRSGHHGKARVLQAGTPLGLMAYLYSRCSPWCPSGHVPRLLRAEGKGNKEMGPQEAGERGSASACVSETAAHFYVAEIFTRGLN